MKIPIKWTALPVIVGAILISGLSPLWARVKLGDLNPPSDSSNHNPLMDGITDYAIGFYYMSMSPTEKGHFDSSNGGFLTFDMGFARKFGAEIAIGKYQQTVKTGDYLFEGETDVLAGLLTLQFFLTQEQAFSPYVSGGVGFYDFDNTIDSDVWDLYNYYNIQFEQDIENSMGYHFGGGVKISPSKESPISFNVDYKYAFIDANILYTLRIQNQKFLGISEIDVGGHMINLGMSFYF